MVVAACTLFLSVLVVDGRHDYRIVGDGLADQRALAAKVRTTRGGTASIWAVGCLHLLAFNHQPNYSPFGMFLDKRVQRYAGPLYRPLVDGRMPRVILWSRAGKFRFPWLKTEYEERRMPEFTRANIRLWIRKRHLASPAGMDPSTSG